METLTMNYSTNGITLNSQLTLDIADIFTWANHPQQKEKNYWWRKATTTGSQMNPRWGLSLRMALSSYSTWVAATWLSCGPYASSPCKDVYTGTSLSHELACWRMVNWMPQVAMKTVFICEPQIPPNLLGWKTSKVFYYSPWVCIEFPWDCLCTLHFKFSGISHTNKYHIRRKIQFTFGEVRKSM